MAVCSAGQVELCPTAISDCYPPGMELATGAGRPEEGRRCQVAHQLAASHSAGTLLFRSQATAVRVPAVFRVSVACATCSAAVSCVPSPTARVVPLLGEVFGPDSPGPTASRSDSPAGCYGNRPPAAAAACIMAAAAPGPRVRGGKARRHAYAHQRMRAHLLIGTLRYLL